MSEIYRKENEERMLGKITELRAELPEEVSRYLLFIEGGTKVSTRYAYVQRIASFYSFLQSYFPELANVPRRAISAAVLSRVTADDLAVFHSEIRARARNKNRAGNTVNHYFSAVSAFFDYLVATKVLESNPYRMMRRDDRPKHGVIRLHEGEDERLLSHIDSGEGLPKHAKSFRSKASVARDKAICHLILHTGLRVSEVVGIDVSDLDLERCRVRVLRKGGGNDTVYFSDSVRDSLLEYLDLRSDLRPAKKEDALFLSSTGAHRGERYSVRSVERMVKKYAQTSHAEEGSAITPHKLRATFATNMIRKTGNLSLVQHELNHRSPNTTSIYIDGRALELEQHRNDLEKNL